MEEKKAPNPALFAVAGILALFGILLGLYGLYNWYQSFGVHDRFAGVGGRLGQLVADKLQRNYQVKGSIGLVLGFFSIVGAAGAGFLGYKGVGSSSKPAALPAQGYGAPPGAPPQSYGPPPQQNYGAPQDQNYGAAMQNYGAPPQQGGYGAPPQQGGYGAPPQQGGFGAPPQPPPGSWGGGQG